MHKQIIIGISSGLVSTPPTDYPSSKPYNYQKVEYSEIIYRLGGIPFLIPNSYTKQDLSKLNDIIDGLILSGGGDINPIRWNEKSVHPKSKFDDIRDDFEFDLFRSFNGPILGICKGMQLMNVALGGSLIQHIPDIPNTINHKEKHSITITESSVLHSIGLNKSIDVISWHHQAIDRIAEDLRVIAYASDGIIEAVENRTGRLLGIQWHPEIDPDENSLALFESFICRCEYKK